jgi:hypothetical protein
MALALIALWAFLIGAIAGMLFLWRVLPSRVKKHIDYKQRWEDAVKLLGTEGSLTQEQVQQITAPDTTEVIRIPPGESGNRMSAASWTYVYEEGGRYAHIGELLDAAHPDSPPEWDDEETWLGTGSQEEYETAKMMQVCPKCIKTRLAAREKAKR